VSAIARIQTFAFSGIEAVPVEVQVQIAPGLPAFLIAGLVPDEEPADERMTPAP
jgi:magnesium chelatase family protein